MKNRNSIPQSCNIPVVSVHFQNEGQPQNVELHHHSATNNQTHHVVNMNGSRYHGSGSKSNATMRDVKPEIITSYASQKKRLLAKAHSECLIGMKQEPGLAETPASNNHHDAPKSIKGYHTSGLAVSIDFIMHVYSSLKA